MDSLPQEIINRMVMFLDRYPELEGVPNISQQRLAGNFKSSVLPPFATISTQWKEAVEFITFHRLEIRSDNLGELRTIVTGNRCKYLRNLNYRILLPEYPEEQGNRAESSEEQQANNTVFTHSIAELFSTLRQWEDAGVLSELRFNLASPKSPSDCFVFESRHTNSYLTLSEVDIIPTVSRISYLQMQGNYNRKMSPSVAPQLMSILPGLKHIYSEFHEEGAQSAVIERRSTFARLLKQTKLPASSIAMFNFHQEAPFDHREATVSVLPQGALFDPFSASLRVFSQNLTTFILDAYVDSTLFWPSIHESCAMLSWPALKKLKISFNTVAPSGTWYFVGTPRNEEDTQYMRHVNQDTLGPFLIAFAKATQQIPVLESFTLECEIGYNFGFFDISYYVPGVKADWSLDWGDEDSTTVRRLYYTVGDVWRPDAFVEETLRNVGRDRHGPALIERFLGPRDWSSRSAWSWFHA
ncbi:hypothetical protein ACET3X_006372 [Alternaria dauci]|uniref:Uncharacterized protein n=1 Tax=Alternaria dauci TaxID=48095 RepID=A0ABR3UG52_9PLEO